MNQSKIELTERLRREGRWAEASQFKDQTVKKLRAGGMKRTEAGEQAWQKMAEAYPPLRPPAPAAASEEVADECEEEMQRLFDVAESELNCWQQKYGITLSDDARTALVWDILMNF